MADLKPTAEITSLEIRSTFDSGDVPPPVATHVSVGGGADTMFVDFFYVAPGRLSRAFQKEPDSRTSVAEGKLTVESVPVARVSLPLTVAADLIVQLFENVIESSGEMQEAMEGLGQRIAAVTGNMGGRGKKR